MNLNKFDKNSIEICSDFLKKGKVLILPTDTIYGFSSIVDFGEEKIALIKGREKGKHFIQLIAEKNDITKITSDTIPDFLVNLWPAPLTIIVHDKNNIENTIAVRCPRDAWLREVIKKTGSPIFSTSVNKAGNAPLTKIDEIKAQFEKSVDLIVDAGDCKNSVPSTIVKIESDKAVVVRQGAVFIKVHSK